MRACRRARTPSRPPIRRRRSTPGPSGCATGPRAASRRLPRVDPPPEGKAKPRDVFAYVIHEGKVRAPAAAMALIERLKDGEARRFSPSATRRPSPMRCWASSSAPRSSSWSTRARSRRRAGPASPSASSPPRSTSGHRLPAPAKARHAGRRPQGGAQRRSRQTLWRIYAKHLKTPDAVAAMDELVALVEGRQAHLPALLRARRRRNATAAGSPRSCTSAPGARVNDLVPPLF